MDNTTFNSEGGEWSTVQPRVWTFYYLFSVEYLESVLSRYGLEYNFQSLPPGAPKQTFLKLLKIEEYPHRTRIHTWEFVEGSESNLPESYRWTDFGSYGIGDRHVWQYEFTHTLLTPFCYMYVALGWKNKEKRETVAGMLRSLETGQAMAFMLLVLTFFLRGAPHVWTG